MQCYPTSVPSKTCGVWWLTCALVTFWFIRMIWNYWVHVRVGKLFNVCFRHPEVLVQKCLGGSWIIFLINVVCPLWYFFFFFKRLPTSYIPFKLFDVFSFWLLAWNENTTYNQCCLNSSSRALLLFYFFFFPFQWKQVREIAFGVFSCTRQHVYLGCLFFKQVFLK